MLRIGLIGSGYIGAVHASAYQKMESTTLVAVADVSEIAGRKISERFGCRYYPQAEQMLQNEEIDVVDICVPTFLHEQYVVLAACCRKHVLCEKPFGLSTESCRRMQRACAEAGVKLMVAQASRWIPEFIKAKALLREGVLGEIHMVSAKRLSQPPAWTGWHRDPRKSGGGLYDLHVHNLDYLYDLFGEVVSVYAMGWKSETGCWNHVTTNLVFKSGVSAVDEASLEMVGDYPFSIGLRIVGDSASLDYDFSGGANIEHCDTAKNTFVLYGKQQPAQKVEIDNTDPYEAELFAFTDAILHDRPVPISPEDSVYVMSIVEAIQESLETGRVVYLSSSGVSGKGLHGNEVL